MNRNAEEAMKNTTSDPMLIKEITTPPEKWISDPPNHEKYVLRQQLRHLKNCMQVGEIEHLGENEVKMQTIHAHIAAAKILKMVERWRNRKARRLKRESRR